MKKNGQAAAFYDLEGTLVSTNLVHTLAFYSRRQQGLFKTIKKIGRHVCQTAAFRRDRFIFAQRL
jgi:hypothetical protein